MAASSYENEAAPDAFGQRHQRFPASSSINTETAAFHLI